MIAQRFFTMGDGGVWYHPYSLHVLGMVLGGIMEVKLRSAMARVKTPLDFVDRPIAALLALAIVALIILHIRGVIREHRDNLPEDAHDHDIHDSQTR